MIGVALIAVAFLMLVYVIFLYLSGITRTVACIIVWFGLGMAVVSIKEAFWPHGHGGKVLCEWLSTLW
jgi:hypothetical protein